MDVVEKAFLQNKKIGLALGGGGARGLAHIPLLEAIDSRSLNICQISGTSVGAIAGAFYAGGMKGKQIRSIFQEILSQKKDFWTRVFEKESSLKWYNLISPQLNGPGILNIDKLIQFLRDQLPCDRFEDLKIPLKIVATDFWNKKEIIFDSGDLLEAIRASTALSGLFPPVLMGETVLVDGGAVNPVPFDLLQECDITIAINVLGDKKPVGESIAPTVFEAMFNTYQIMEESIILQKMKFSRPDIYIKPDISNIRVMDFQKAEDIFDQTQTAVEDFHRQYESLFIDKG